jgi:3-isopropylmalate dehydratase small subunit
MDYDEYKQLFELDDNKENLYELADEIYFKAIKGKEKQFIIELKDGSTENTEDGSKLYWSIENTAESMMKEGMDKVEIKNQILSYTSTFI